MIADYAAGKVLLALFMAVCAVRDLRHKGVEQGLFLCMAFLEAGVYAAMAAGGRPVLWKAAAAGLLTGGGIWILSLLSRGGIGSGDAAFFALTGAAMGAPVNLLVFGLSMMACVLFGLAAVFLRMRKGRGVKGLRFPLLPVVLPFGLAALYLK